VFLAVLWAVFLSVVLATTVYSTESITEHGIAIQAVNPCEEIEAECERLRAVLAVYTGVAK